MHIEADATVVWQIVSFLFFQWGGGRELNLSVCCSLYNSPEVAAVRDDTMNGIINAMNNQDEPVKVLLAFDSIFRLGKTCFVPVVRNGRFAGCVSGSKIGYTACD
jgi:hypothetical protein